jgi:hypothetical protein
MHRSGEAGLIGLCEEKAEGALRFLGRISAGFLTINLNIKEVSDGTRTL